MNEILQWVREEAWRDGFNYPKELQNTRLPPALYLTGAHDRVWGHPHDSKCLMEETGAGNARMLKVGKSSGFSCN